MALNDAAVVSPSVGYLFIAPVGTARPSPAEIDSLNLDTFATLVSAGWEQIGHTSRDDMPEFGYDGGDTEMIGTWQKKRLREVESGDPVADSVTITLVQFDKLALELYFGKDSSTTSGVFDVDGKFKPVEKALLIVIVDGDTRLGFHASKASIKREEAIDLPVDGLTGLPVKASFLDMTGRPLYSWISEALLGAGASPSQYNVSFGGATAGSAVLSANGQPTTTIPYSATPAAVKSALVALDDGFTAADWTVTGSAGAYVVSVPPGVVLTGDGTGLTGGTLTITPA